MPSASVLMRGRDDACGRWPRGRSGGRRHAMQATQTPATMPRPTSALASAMIDLLAEVAGPDQGGVMTSSERQHDRLVEAEHDLRAARAAAGPCGGSGRGCSPQHAPPRSAPGDLADAVVGVADRRHDARRSPASWRSKSPTRNSITTGMMRQKAGRVCSVSMIGWTTRSPARCAGREDADRDSDQRRRSRPKRRRDRRSPWPSAQLPLTAMKKAKPAVRRRAAAALLPAGEARGGDNREPGQAQQKALAAAP